jgi:arylsulfatase A-like enzyme
LRVNHEGGGDTGACQVHRNDVARELYHTDWVAERTIAYLDSLPEDADWFVWMSFPDPHHPWDPPASETDRVRWRDIDVPAGFPKNAEGAARILADKPHHWLEYFEGRKVSNMEAPPGFLPRAMTSDQLREIDALTHVENELIDEACGRVLDRIREKGWEADTDVFFTTDHGELQGDFGLLFKGPYHVDGLMRIPLIWRPAPSAGIAPAIVDAPVGQVDFAPTFCQIAGLATPDWMQGRALPQHQREANIQDRQRVLTEWDSHFQGDSIHLRTIYRDGYTCTVYEKSSLYEGSEGELYDHSRDPLQHENLWNDPAYASVRSDLVADLYDSLPPEPDERAEVVAPV